jgi:hypothetical protein
MEKVCLFCNKSFKIKNARLFCSTICRTKHNLYIKNKQNTNHYIKSCYTCSNNFLGSSRILYCSEECRIPKKERLQRERQSIKKQLMEYKGSICMHCKKIYDLSVMCFHHLRDKKFTLDTTKLLKYDRETLLKEADKCELLCHNCHAIVHEKQSNDNVQTLSLGEQNKRDKRYNKKRTFLELLGNKCVYCGWKSEFISTLSFDHIGIKNFQLTSTGVRGKTEQEILYELAQCQIACINCHILKNSWENRKHKAEPIKELLI